jgi:hypothetical protein
VAKNKLENVVFLYAIYSKIDPSNTIMYWGYKRYKHWF